MRIDQTAGPAGFAGELRTRRRKPGFSVPPDDEPSAAPASVPAGAASSIEAMALVEAGGKLPEPVSDQAAAGHGGAVLQAMAGLQLANLQGGGSEARHALAALLDGLPKATDPGLDSVLQAIGQRAAVELARSK